MAKKAYQGEFRREKQQAMRVQHETGAATWEFASHNHRNLQPFSGLHRRASAEYVFRLWLKNTLSQKLYTENRGFGESWI